MTDKATDLWKSLRIWATGWAESTDRQDRPHLFLLTTAEAAAEGATYHLRPPGLTRGVARALSYASDDHIQRLGRSGMDGIV